LEEKMFSLKNIFNELYTFENCFLHQSTR